jgi:hypothetical protein
MSKITNLVRRILDNNQGRDVPVPRKIYEIGYLYMTRGFGPGYYFDAGLSRRDRSMAFKKGFYGHKMYHKRVSELNDPSYSKLPQNKLPEAALFALLGIPAPRTYGHLCMRNGLDMYGLPLRTGADLERFLSAVPVQRFCAKETEGWNGRGFVACDVVRDADQPMLRVLGSNDLISCDEFAQRYAQYTPQGNRILQEYIEQHPAMEALNPSSVNTVRMMVYQPESGPPRAFGAFARIGRAGVLVDNVGAGGMWAVADLDTGRLGPGRRPKLDIDYAQHPDHGSPIEGAMVPDWEAAKEVACRTLAAFPSTRYLGVDVAFTANGPLIIEVNNKPDYIDFAILEVPPEQALNG